MTKKEKLEKLEDYYSFLLSSKDPELLKLKGAELGREFVRRLKKKVREFGLDFEKYYDVFFVPKE